MNYKVGDKVLCKKGLSSFNVGEYYNIDYVEDNGITIKDRFFYHSTPSNRYGVFLFSKNFYTTEELRIMKLEKINGI